MSFVVRGVSIAQSACRAHHALIVTRLPGTIKVVIRFLLAKACQALIDEEAVSFVSAWRLRPMVRPSWLMGHSVQVIWILYKLVERLTISRKLAVPKHALVDGQEQSLAVRLPRDMKLQLAEPLERLAVNRWQRPATSLLVKHAPENDVTRVNQSLPALAVEADERRVYLLRRDQVK
jgi:hypothetical protein